MTTQSEILDDLVRATTDVRAFQRYMIEVLELQRLEPALRDDDLAIAWTQEVIELFREQVARIDQQMVLLRGSRDALRTSTGLMASAFIGFLNKNRSHDFMKIIRDDVALLNLARMIYLRVHTTAMQLNKTAIAHLAALHREQLSAIVQPKINGQAQLNLVDLPAEFCDAGCDPMHIIARIRDSEPPSVVRPVEIPA